MKVTSPILVTGIRWADDSTIRACRPVTTEPVVRGTVQHDAQYGS